MKKRGTKRNVHIRNMNIFGKVKELHLFNLKKMKTVALYSDVKNNWKSAGTKNSPNILRARNNGSRLQQGNLRLDIKKHF